MKRILILILNICLCIIVGTTSIYAWYTNYFIKPTDDINLSSNSAYFDSGDGTEGTPYIIKEPRHLYNLAWLQDLGFFDDKVYYFKLDSDIDMSSIGKIPPIGIDGKGVGTKGDTTNENKHHFIGNFNGNNKTIKNLKISNFGFTTYPEMASKSNGDFDNGFVFGNNFGLFGHFSAKVNSGETSTKSNITNLKISNVTVDVSQNSTTGMVAGYVNGPISNVGVATPKLSFASGVSVESDYGLIGKASDSVINDFTGRGSGQTDFNLITKDVSFTEEVSIGESTLFSYPENKGTTSENLFYKANQYSVWGAVSFSKNQRSWVPYFHYDGGVKVASNVVGRAFVINVVANRSGVAQGILKVAATSNNKADDKSCSDNSGRFVALYKVEPFTTETTVDGKKVTTKADVIATGNIQALPAPMATAAVNYKLPYNETQYNTIITNSITFTINEPGYYVIGSQSNGLNFLSMDFKYTNPDGDSGLTYSLTKVDFLDASRLTSNIADNTASTVTFLISGTTTGEIVLYFRREEDKVYYYIPEDLGLTTKAYGSTGKHIKEDSNTNFT